MPDTVGWPQRDVAPVWAPGISSLVATASPAPPAGRALVLAAGESADALWLAGRGWKVTVASADPMAVSRIAAEAALLDVPVEAIATDLLSYRPQPERYRLILLDYLELSCSQLRRMLARLAPGLAGDGRLVIVAVDARNRDSGFGGPANPDLLTSIGQVSDVLSGLDLEVHRAEVFRREVPVEIGVRYALDHLIVAARPATVPGPASQLG